MSTETNQKSSIPRILKRTSEITKDIQEGREKIKKDHQRRIDICDHLSKAENLPCDAECEMCVLIQKPDYKKNIFLEGVHILLWCEVYRFVQTNKKSQTRNILMKLSEELVNRIDKIEPLKKCPFGAHPFNPCSDKTPRCPLIHHMSHVGELDKKCFAEQRKTQCKDELSYPSIISKNDAISIIRGHMDIPHHLGNKRISNQSEIQKLREENQKFLSFASEYNDIITIMIKDIGQFVDEGLDALKEGSSKEEPTAKDKKIKEVLEGIRSVLEKYEEKE